MYIKNRLPHSALPGPENNITSYEILYEIKPKIAHMHPFGALCFVHIPIEKHPAGSKLDPGADTAIFLGYTDSVFIYRVQLMASEHIYTVPAKECKFPPFIVSSQPPQPSLQSQTSQSFRMQRTLSSPRQSLPPSPQVQSLPPQQQTEAADIAMACIVEAVALFEPRIYEEAVNSINSHLWKEAIHDELRSMEQHHVWTMVPKSVNRTV